MKRKRSNLITEEEIDFLISRGKCTLIIDEEDPDFIAFKKMREEEQLDNSIGELAEDFETRIFIDVVDRNAREEAPSIGRIMPISSDDSEDNVDCYSDKSDETGNINVRNSRPLSGVKVTLISREEDNDTGGSVAYSASVAEGLTSDLSFCSHGASNFLGAPLSYAAWMLGFEHS